MRDSKQILITGGDGYLGRKLARLYLEQSDLPVHLWVRAGSEEEFRGKGQALCREFCSTEGRLRLSWGDLRAEDPFARTDPGPITAIVHTAAVTRFNVEQQTAEAVNVDGFRKLLAFAAQCPQLDVLALCSTVYSSGLRSGILTEEPLDDATGFSNYYEWSKNTAEKLAQSSKAQRSVIFRIATAIADTDSGRVVQQNAFHNTLRLLYYGLLSMLPGLPETPLYFVTGDFVARSIFEILQQKSANGIYHVAHTKSESINLGQLMDVVFESFREYEDFRLRRVLPPLFSDLDTFRLLADAAMKFTGGVVQQAVSSVAPFSGQLFVSKDIRNDRLRASLRSYAAPDASELVRKTCRYLVETKWGRS